MAETFEVVRCWKCGRVRCEVVRPGKVRVWCKDCKVFTVFEIDRNGVIVLTDGGVAK